MDEYLSVGAAKEVPFAGTKFLVPWFVIQKVDSSGKEKLRLISDCRRLNNFLNPLHFKLDHWKDIFPFLRQNMWATKLDLKNAYFHLQLSEAIKPYVRMQIGERLFQMEGGCFGLSTLPYWWTKVMAVFLKKWRQKGLLVFIYLDDILLLAQSEGLAIRHTEIMLKDLLDSGMTVNLEKSSLQPSQRVEHLGFTINMVEGRLEVPPAKVKMVRKELGKLLTLRTISCRKVAAILGQVRSFLTALPALRAFTDHLVAFTNKHAATGWDTNLTIPGDLQEQVKEVGLILASWKGRRFEGDKETREIYSDSSNYGWGALETQSGNQVQDFWRSEMGLHINIKELKAAVAAVQSLAHPGEVVHLAVDNQVAYHYLRKGGGYPTSTKFCGPFCNGVRKTILS